MHFLNLKNKLPNEVEIMDCSDNVNVTEIINSLRTLNKNKNLKILHFGELVESSYE